LLFTKKTGLRQKRTYDLNVEELWTFHQGTIKYMFHCGLDFISTMFINYCSGVMSKKKFVCAKDRTRYFNIWMDTTYHYVEMMFLFVLGLFHISPLIKDRSRPKSRLIHGPALELLPVPPHQDVQLGYVELLFICTNYMNNLRIYQVVLVVSIQNNVFS
jgi:hypothetical protein